MFITGQGYGQVSVYDVLPGQHRVQQTQQINTGGAAILARLPALPRSTGTPTFFPLHRQLSKQASKTQADDRPSPGLTTAS